MNRPVIALEHRFIPEFFGSPITQPIFRKASLSSAVSSMAGFSSVQDRDVIEHEGSGYVHPVSYAILVDQNGFVFLYQRAKGVGEERLLGKTSLGVGGHIDYHAEKQGKYNPADLRKIILGSLVQELEEEIHDPYAEPDLKPPPELYSQFFQGIMYDPRQPVERVHLALVFMIPVVDVNAITLNEPFLIKQDPVHFTRSFHPGIQEMNFELWSSFLLEHLPIWDIPSL